MVRIILIAIGPLAITAVVRAEQPCAVKRSDLIASTSVPITKEKIDAIRPGMTMLEILKILGPATRNIGSGLVVLQWKDTKGKYFVVGALTPCEPVAYAEYK